MWGMTNRIFVSPVLQLPLIPGYVSKKHIGAFNDCDIHAYLTHPYGT